MRRLKLPRLAALASALVLLFTATACGDPIVNAPPGGGEVIQTAYTIGPFNLSPMGQSGSESQSVQGTIPRPSGAFGLKSITFDLVDAAGNPVGHGDVHLHHVVLMNNARTSPYCSNWPERFAAAGSERTPMAMPDPYAYMVGANDRWSALWHVMNMSDTPRQVYIQYKMGYQPGATAQNTRGVTPFFLDITGCGNSEYDIPGDGGPDSIHTRSRTWETPWEGYFVGSGGHVHGGGIDITIKDDVDNLWCTMTAKYEHSHHGGPGSITACTPHEHFGAGDPFTVTARYENDEPLDGVMGIVLAYAWRGTQ
jgi:hypothetical protein